MNTWAEHLLNFYSNLQPPVNLPNNVQWLYPQKDTEVIKLVQKFTYKYFNDSNKRKLILGINPGRFGAGITGINFTAPKQLKEVCGIDHHFKINSELSADFIYEMISSYGGAEKFYSHFFISSVCPLGFVREGKNINYYDDKELSIIVEPFIIESLEKHLSFPVDRTVCFCVGGEKNFNYLNKLNDQYKWFDKITPLPHPRFIMQYRRKKVFDFIEMYISALTA